MTAPLPLLTEAEVRSIVDGTDPERASFGALRCAHGLLPLAAVDIKARILGTFAHTTLTQTFINNSGTAIEATYIFPLPDRAAATKFSMEVAGRRVDGVLQERGQARQTYDRAIATGKRASIAEEERPGTFSLRVGNLMPGEAATITLELTGPLPVTDGECTYRFPLVVAPRYIPGRALPGEQVGDGIARDTDAVPDASRISPPVWLRGYPNPVRLGIEVTLDPAGLPLSKVRSALHAAWADESQGLLRVHVGSGERLDRDFILRFCLADPTLRSVARATKRADGGDDAFLLTVLPPSLASTTTRPREIVFLLDRSGSMGGWKMVAARRAVARMVDSLRADDRFCVLAFDDEVDVVPELGNKLVQATDRNRFRAVEWLARVDARGGTEMAQPLADGADLLGQGFLQSDRVLVFVTDGQVGNEAQLLKMLGNRLRGARVFALGIDQAVNAGFMNRLAALGGSGEAELVESEDRVDEALARCHRRIDTPVLTDLSIVIDGATLIPQTLAPQRLPDVFAGVPAVVAGRVRRHRGGGRPTVAVRGRRADGSWHEERVPLEPTANASLLPAWGRLHLRDLEDRFDGNREDKSELERRIVAASLEAGVLCRFTAFVAVDHEVVNEGGRMARVVQAVEAPADLRGAAKAGPAPRARHAMPASPRFGAPTPAPASAPARRSTASFDGVGDSFDDEQASFDEPTGSDLRFSSAEDAFSAADGYARAEPAGLRKETSSRTLPRGPRAAAARPVGQAAMAPPPSSAPPAAPATASSESAAGGFFGSIARAVANVVGGGGSSNESARAKRDASADTPAPPPPSLVAFAERIELLVERLEHGEPTDEVADDLQLLVEEVALAGVPPTARQPLVDALRALAVGDVAKALMLLRPHGKKATARAGGFWR
jgi:Ca-activated chloride channel family protein